MTTPNHNLFPLTPLQDHLLAKALASPKVSGCSISQTTLRIEGIQDAEPLKSAWIHTICSHESLRLVFALRPSGGRRQFIKPLNAVNIEQHDWSRFSRTKTEEYLKTFLRADRHLGFGLSGAAFFRLSLLKIAKQSHICVLSHHSAIADREELIRILRTFFRFFLQSSPHLTTDKQAISNGFPHYVQNLENRRQSEATAKFWAGYLNGYTPPFRIRHGIQKQLTNDLRQETAIAMVTRRKAIPIPEEISETINDYASRHKISVATFFLGAWFLVLSHFYGKRDMLVSALLPFGPSSTPEALPVQSNFVPVRMEIAPKAELVQFLRQIQHGLDRIHNHRLEHLDDIGRWSRPPSPEQLYDIMFSYTADDLCNIPSNIQIDIDEWLPGKLYLKASGTKCLDLCYDRRQYRPDEIRQLGDALALFFLCLEGPHHQTLCDIPLSHVPDAASFAAEPLHSQSTVHQLLAIVSATSKTSPAISQQGTALTFGTLWENTQRISDFLTAKGFGQGNQILIVAQGHFLVSGILGIFKTGATCLLPGVSPSRQEISGILEKTSVELVLIEQQYRHLLPHTSTKTEELHSILEMVPSGKRPPESANVPPVQTACLFFPEASPPVAVSHGVLAAQVQSANEVYNIGPLDRVFFYGPPPIEILVTGMLMTLLGGGTIVQGDAAPEKTGKELVRFCSIQRVTVLFLPPATNGIRTNALSDLPETLHTVVTYCHPSNPTIPDLGESILTKLRWLHVWTMPETAGHFSYVDLSETSLTSGPGLPMGRTFPNTGLHVANHFNQFALFGTPGELVISGSQFAGQHTGPGRNTVQLSGPQNTIVLKTGLTAVMLSDKDVRLLSSHDHTIEPNRRIQKRRPVNSNPPKTNGPVVLIGNSVAAARAYQNADLQGHAFYHAPIFIHLFSEAQTPQMLGIKEIARKCLRDLEAAHPRGPYILVGECQNAVVAHEAACQLAGAGRPADLLVIIDENWNPNATGTSSHDDTTHSSWKKHVTGFQEKGAAYLVQKIRIRMKKMTHNMIRRFDRVRQLAAGLLSRPVPEDIQFRSMESVFYSACEALPYTPERYDGPVLLLYSEGWYKRYAPALNRYYTGPVRKKTFPIEHSEWFSAAQVSRILTEINHSLGNHTDINQVRETDA